MPAKLREFIDEIRDNESHLNFVPITIKGLDFLTGGLTNICGAPPSPLKETWIDALETARIKIQEEVDGVSLENSKVKVYTEYN